MEKGDSLPHPEVDEPFSEEGLLVRRYRERAHGLQAEKSRHPECQDQDNLSRYCKPKLEVSITSITHVVIQAVRHHYSKLQRKQVFSNRKTLLKFRIQRGTAQITYRAKRVQRKPKRVGSTHSKT